VKAVRQTRVPLLASTFVLLAGICSGGQAGKNLIINGQIASSDLRSINGRTYVPLADVAKALNMTLVNKPHAIEMTPAGGANEVAGLRGKIGDQLFTGKWRFTANSIDQMDSYTTKYAGSQETISPRNAQETLFVLNCRIKNGQKEPMEMVFTQNKCGNTALTDDQEHSFAPISYDAHNETGPYGGPKMLPGSAAEFAVIFSAPKGTKPKDVIFTIISGKDLQDSKPGVDLRISLRQ
jgi:hypothetical protein